MEALSLIDQIVAIEWEMFTSVSNVGGRAACQEDARTFRIMRRSQAQTWSPALQASYLEDLKTAQLGGINLMSIKYARMMETTHPQEYARLKGELPPVEAAARGMVAEITAVHRTWDQAMIARYPYLRGRGRPASTAEDSSFATSAETYLRGELLTYSARTISLYYQEVMQAKSAGINLAEQTLSYMVKAYGYDSLDEAENRLAK